MESQELGELTFVSPDNLVLRTPAKPVLVEERLLPETQDKIQKMRDFANNIQEREKRRLAGLAAPQLGIPECIIFVRIGKDLVAFINPEITWQSDEKEEFWEGCFSLQSDSGFICGIVSRPYAINVKALTEEGETIERQYFGQEARRILHEMDHLNGKDFVSHITDPDNMHLVKPDEVDDYRRNWANWPRKCSRELYEQIKGSKRIGELENK